MATVNPISDAISSAEHSQNALLVMLAPMPPEQLDAVLTALTASFPHDGLIVSTPAPFTADSHPDIKIVPAPPANPSMTITSADFVSAHQLAEQHQARAILLLGQESASLAQSAMRSLAAAVMSSAADLAIPRYDLPPRAALVNSALLYPLTRALFGTGARFPLAIDLGLSPRMAERLAWAAGRFDAANQGESLLWPVNEASLAGFAVSEIPVGPRALPRPVDPDINSILAHVTGSLFADIEAKAAFWQRARRPAAARNHFQSLPSSDPPADIAPMLESFHFAYSNLRDIWSLVLPPNSLLGLKRLSNAQASAFVFPDDLWARIVYDFLLAFRLRTIHRGHLMGALIPLYLAWVASHVNITSNGVDSERHIEAVAAAFEAEKPYLVSRWRWPDRFNP